MWNVPRYTIVGISGLLLVLLVAACGQTSAPETGQEVVNVYSARHYGTVEEVFERFTDETGIEVRLS